MSREVLKECRRVVSVKEMTHYTEIYSSIITKASNKTLGFAVGGPNHRRRRFGHRSSVNVTKDDCDLISPEVTTRHSNPPGSSAISTSPTNGFPFPNWSGREGVKSQYR